MTDDIQLKALAKEIEFLRGKIDSVKEIADRNEVKTGYNAYDKIDLIKKALEGI